MRRVRESKQQDLIMRVRGRPDLLGGVPSAFDFRVHAAPHIENHDDRDRGSLTEEVFDLLWLLAFVQLKVSLVQAYYDAIHSVGDGHRHKHQVDTCADSM